MCTCHSSGRQVDLQVVKSGRWFAIAIGVVGVVVSPFLMFTGTGLFTWLQTVNGFFNVPILTIILLGYVTKRVSSRAANIGLVFFVTLYGLSQLVFNDQLDALNIHFMHVSAILFVVTSTLILVLGKIWPREEAWVMPTSNVVEMTPWKYRFRMGGFVLGAMVSMYVVFSSFGLASGDGLRPVAFATVVALLVGGPVLGFFADRWSPAQVVQLADGTEDRAEGERISM